MSTPEALTAGFVSAPEDKIAIDQESLDRFFKKYLGPELLELDQVEYTQLLLRQVGESTGELQARSRGWVIHLGRDLAQGALVGSLMAIVMRALSQTDLSLVVLPAILPLLFQIEKAKVSMANEELLIHLYRKVGSQTMDTEALFQAIPDNIRENVNRLDFLDFLESISEAGLAQEIREGQFQLSHPDYPRLRIKINW